MFLQSQYMYVNTYMYARIYIHIYIHTHIFLQFFIKKKKTPSTYLFSFLSQMRNAREHSMQWMKKEETE